MLAVGTPGHAQDGSMAQRIDLLLQLLPCLLLLRRQNCLLGPTSSEQFRILQLGVFREPFEAKKLRQ